MKSRTSCYLNVSIPHIKTLNQEKMFWIWIFKFKLRSHSSKQIRLNDSRFNYLNFTMQQSTLWHQWNTTKHNTTQHNTTQLGSFDNTLGLKEPWDPCSQSVLLVIRFFNRVEPVTKQSVLVTIKWGTWNEEPY